MAKQFMVQVLAYHRPIVYECYSSTTILTFHQLVFLDKKVHSTHGGPVRTRLMIYMTIPTYRVYRIHDRLQILRMYHIFAVAAIFLHGKSLTVYVENFACENFRQWPVLCTM